MSRDWFEDVLEFHRKLAPQVVRPMPAVPPSREEQDYCLGFIEEELAETCKAMRAGDLPEVADGLADLIYVAIRAALIWGIDLRPVWDEVHRVNMQKMGGATREDGKVTKPPGWMPPEIARVLAQQQPLSIGGPR
jgi:predicted HAD superfamily Cof-like phosphohydrolase